MIYEIETVEKVLVSQRVYSRVEADSEEEALQKAKDGSNDIDIYDEEIEDDLGVQEIVSRNVVDCYEE